MTPHQLQQLFAKGEQLGFVLVKDFVDYLNHHNITMEDFVDYVAP